MTIPFEPTRSYAYRAARYELLPQIAEMARAFGNEPFLLREISKQVLAETYPPEQLAIPIKKAQSDRTEKMGAIFRFYIPFLAENLKVFEYLGGGMFKNISIDEELAEADAVATDVESDDSGIIYAYSFPSIKKNDGRFPIKIGLTTTGDANARVTQQCKQTSCFEYPIVLKTWEVLREGYSSTFLELTGATMMLIAVWADREESRVLFSARPSYVSSRSSRRFSLARLSKHRSFQVEK